MIQNFSYKIFHQLSPKHMSAYVFVFVCMCMCVHTLHTVYMLLLLILYKVTSKKVTYYQTNFQTDCCYCISPS